MAPLLAPDVERVGVLERSRVPVGCAEQGDRLLARAQTLSAHLQVLADDASVYPMRGQTMLIDAPDIALGYMDNERVDHIFPRADGVLIGGVKLDGDWQRELDPAISADIIQRTSTIESGIADAKVRREFTGLRPGRAQVRLELERRPSPSGPAVIHNYGHGSVGYTLSWGCAQEVAALARDFV